MSTRPLTRSSSDRDRRRDKFDLLKLQMKTPANGGLQVPPVSLLQTLKIKEETLETELGALMIKRLKIEKEILEIQTLRMEIQLREVDLIIAREKKNLQDQNILPVPFSGGQ